MRRNHTLISCSLGFAIVFAIVATAGSGVLAQRTSQGVVTPDDPIWAGAQEPQEPQPQPQEPQQEAPANDQAAGGRGGRGGAPGQPRPYNQVMTSEARTDE